VGEQLNDQKNGIERVEALELSAAQEVSQRLARIKLLRETAAKGLSLSIVAVLMQVSVLSEVEIQRTALKQAAADVDVAKSKKKSLEDSLSRQFVRATRL
jgi:hypothetical protein